MRVSLTREWSEPSSGIGGSFVLRIHLKRLCCYLRTINTRIAPLIYDKIREQFYTWVYTSSVELLRISKVRLRWIGAVTGSKGDSDPGEGKGETVVNGSTPLFVVDERLSESVERVPAVPGLDVTLELSGPIEDVKELSSLFKSYKISTWHSGYATLKYNQCKWPLKPCWFPPQEWARSRG